MSSPSKHYQRTAPRRSLRLRNHSPSPDLSFLEQAWHRNQNDALSSTIHTAGQQRLLYDDNLDGAVYKTEYDAQYEDDSFLHIVMTYMVCEVLNRAS